MFSVNQNTFEGTFKYFVRIYSVNKDLDIKKEKLSVDK